MFCKKGHLLIKGSVCVKMKGDIGLHRKIATNLISLCSVYKEKMVKTTHTKEHSVHTNSENCNI